MGVRQVIRSFGYLQLKQNLNHFWDHTCCFSPTTPRTRTRSTVVNYGSVAGGKALEYFKWQHTNSEIHPMPYTIPNNQYSQ